MVTREEFLQLKNVVQEIRSEMRKFQVDVLQRFAVSRIVQCVVLILLYEPVLNTQEIGRPTGCHFIPASDISNIGAYPHVCPVRI